MQNSDPFQTPIFAGNGWLPAPVAHFGVSGLMAWCYPWLVSIPQLPSG
jgi:hypothetical protein